MTVKVLNRKTENYEIIKTQIYNLPKFVLNCCNPQSTIEKDAMELHIKAGDIFCNGPLPTKKFTYLLQVKD